MSSKMDFEQEKSKTGDDKKQTRIGGTILDVVQDVKTIIAGDSSSSQAQPQPDQLSGPVLKDDATSRVTVTTSLSEHGGGETHQRYEGEEFSLTSDQGVPVADNQNSLTMGVRGPVLLEDFLLREKIMRFDHERIPERVVHARGSGAHGYFECNESLAEFTSADLFQRAGERTPVFVRFSTVLGSRGAADTFRDVRGFAVKFYSKTGNWDLVGNNIPVFFVQDAIKFPDLIHAGKPEANRDTPQGQTAHTTFWDFVSLMPESTHMLMWAMSDRALPRSYRTMQGFGVHTFRFVNAAGESTFVKFHWKPKQGMQSLLLNEAIKLAGAAPDFHRTDLWHAIETGDFPEWELGVQLFDETFANSLPFDVLDATKLIPEELLPVRPIGRLVLDRNPNNFFAETEQIAFCAQNVVPGIDFTNDPLLQGRLFSYLDTQLTRLGGPNFALLPINAPRCPFANFNRDGFMNTLQHNIPGRANYEPNSLAELGDAEPNGPRETSSTGFRSFVGRDHDTKSQKRKENKLRVRTALFADHYTQARLFYRSLDPVEQTHTELAFVFELAHVPKLVQHRMLSNLRNVDETLAQRVANGLGVSSLPVASPAAAPVRDMTPSTALRVVHGPLDLQIVKGRMIGVLIGNKTNAAQLRAFCGAVTALGGETKLVASCAAPVQLADGSSVNADATLMATPSILFDGIAVLLDAEQAREMCDEADAVQFVNDAFVHLKSIAYSSAAEPLLTKAGVTKDDGVFQLADVDNVGDVAKLMATRHWKREGKVRTIRFPHPHA